MSSYKARTETTKPIERDLKKEVPLGVLGIGWHNSTVRNLTVSSTSVTFNAVDQYGDKLGTRLFIRQFDNPQSINERLKAFLAAVCADENELMSLVDMLLDGELHVLGTLDGRKLRVLVGYNGNDLDIIRFTRSSVKPIGF